MPQETERETAVPQPVEGFEVGKTVEHRLMPGFRMVVQDGKPCETDAAHPVPHPAYLVTDPEGEDDWVCHYDVQKPGAGLPWGVPG